MTQVLATAGLLGITQPGRLVLHGQVELERSGEGGLLLDDAGSFDLLEDDHRLMMPGGAGPGAAAAAGGGLMGRSKR
jgi:hypothetical protein